MSILFKLVRNRKTETNETMTQSSIYNIKHIHIWEMGWGIRGHVRAIA